MGCMAKRLDDVHPHHGKPLIIAGAALFLAGLLRFYNIDWSVVLMIVGVLLLAKGLVIKLARNKRI